MELSLDMPGANNSRCGPVEGNQMALRKPWAGTATDRSWEGEVVNLGLGRGQIWGKSLVRIRFLGG